MLVKELLENNYLNKRVSIVMGHPNNNQHIIATVIGYKDGYGKGEISWRDKFFICLKDISTNHYSLEYGIKMGQYDEHYFRLDTDITIIRDENLKNLGI